MKGKLSGRWAGILALLLLLVVFAGCQQAEEKSNVQSNVQENTGTQGEQQGQQTQEQTEEQTEGQQIDLSKYKTLADLMALGKGVYCEGSQNVNGETVHYKYWVKSGNMRAEIARERETVIAVVRNGDTYVSEKQIKQMGCDWFKLPKGEQQVEQQPVEEDKSYTEPEKVNLADFNCKVYSVSDDMFNTPGKVCTLQDLMAQYMPQR